MIRTVIIPETSSVQISLSFPDNYIGEEVEVIAFAKHEGLTSVPDKNVAFTVLHVDAAGYRFNREEAHER